MAVTMFFMKSFNALAGIFAFRTEQSAPPLGYCPHVSMPSRAFLLFGRMFTSGKFCIFIRFNALAGIFAFRTNGVAQGGGRVWAGFNALAGIFAFRTRGNPPLTRRGASAAFQCPRGHFCFSDTVARGGTARRQTRFNALAGIFAFRTITPVGDGLAAEEWFQCPRGHFCFSDSIVRDATMREIALVSMPSRAFLLFGLARQTTVSSGKVSLVSMPSRAFLLFGRFPPKIGGSGLSMFQCPRGHFCFSDNVEGMVQE